jgi:hypothetical protein
MARRLNAAHGAAQVLNLAFVVKLLLLSQFNEPQHFLHMFERLLQGLNNLAHVIRSLRYGRDILLDDLMALNGRSWGRWPCNNGRFGRFNRSRFHWRRYSRLR